MGLIDLDGVSECFVVKTNMLAGSFVLLASALLYVFLGIGVLRSMQRRLEQRIIKFKAS